MGQLIVYFRSGNTLRTLPEFYFSEGNFILKDALKFEGRWDYQIAKIYTNRYHMVLMGMMFTNRYNMYKTISYDTNRYNSYEPVQYHKIKRYDTIW